MQTRRRRLSLPESARAALLELIRKESSAGRSQLPSERQLAEQLNISRPTLREALRMLEQEGTVIRHVGVGTFINEGTTIEAGMESLDSFTEMIARSGHKVGTSKLVVKEGKFDSEDAERFGVETGEVAIRVERVRTIDGRPAMYSLHTCPKEIVGEVADEEYRGSLFALIERRTGTSLSHSYTHIYSALASDDIARKLRLAGGMPLLVLDELIYDTAGRMVCTSLSFFRADIHSYHMVRRRPGGGAM